MPSSFLEWVGFLSVVVLLAIVFGRLTRGVTGRGSRRVLGIVFIFVLIAVLSMGEELYETVFSPSPTVTPYPTRTKRPVTPTPTRETCYRWDEIKPSMDGREVCVFGTVHSVYTTGESWTRVRFTSEPNNFFLSSSNYTFDDLAAGSCVLAYGTVELYERIPFVEVGGKLYHCKSWMK